MTTTWISALLVTTLAIMPAAGSESDGKWVTDWPDLSEKAHWITSASLKGVLMSGEEFSIKILARTVKSKELQKISSQKYYGLNRRGEEAMNTQMTSLELIRAGQTMNVPKAALDSILNAQIGERMEVVLVNDSSLLEAVIIHGPVGAEGYMVAFIFENGRFVRRQIRSDTPTEGGWRLLENKAF